MGPDGQVIMTGDGVIVGETISAVGITSSVLTLPRVAEDQSGRYSCTNGAVNVSARIDVTGEHAEQ